MKNAMIKVTYLDGSVSIISRERYANLMRSALRCMVKKAHQVRKA